MSERLNYHFNVDPDVPGQLEEYTQSITIDNGLKGSSNNIRFTVPPHDTDCTDGSEMDLELVFNVTDEDGTALDDSDDVFLCNGAFGNFFSQINVSLNGHPLPPVTEAAYTAFLVDRLGSSKAYRKSVLYPLGFTGKSLETHSAITGLNQISYGDNKKKVANSKDVRLSGRIASDFLATCAHLIPNKVAMELSLIRNRDSFILGSSEAKKSYKINLKECTLGVKRVRLNPAGQELLEKSLATSGHLKYQRLSTRVQTVSLGSQSFRWNNIFHSSQLPSRVFVGLVNQKSYMGQLDYYPMFFESANVSSVRFLVDGREILPKPYQPKFKYVTRGDGGRALDHDNCEVSSPMRGLSKALGTFSNRATTVGLTEFEWLAGLSVYAATLPAYGGMETPKGCLDVVIDFSPHIGPGSYVCLVMGEFDKVLEIKGPERSVTVTD